MENNVQLRDVIDSDLPIFFEHQSDRLAAQMVGFSSRDWDAFAAHWAKIRRAPTGFLKTILYEGQVAGHVVSFETEDNREVGYWIGRDYWGKGIATQALGQFLEVEQRRPLYGYVAKHNVGSRRVLEKCGFEQLGEEEKFLVFILT
jgi:RimJ/RimL family protein N-acetyltransferase